MAGAGVGEAMLLGAAMGGGSAALTGGDPLKGALLGGLTGGVGGGISTALGAAGTTAGTLGTEAVNQIGTQAATQAGTQLGTEAAANLATSTVNPGITTLANGLPPDISNQILGQVAPTGGAPVAEIAAKGSLNPATGQFVNTTLPQMSYDSFGTPALQGSPAATMADPTGLAQQQLNLNSAAAQAATPGSGQGTFMEGMQRFANDPMASLKANKFTAVGSGLAGAIGGREEMKGPEEYDGPLKRFKFNPDSYQPSFFAAEGGIATLASGGYDRMVGEQPMYSSNMARGGISDLGSYSDYARGGRMLKGPGDGMSDSIPASIGGKRPARLATEEFVVPADVVSHLGNGSSDAGAKQLYAMMDKVRTARTGRKSQGREIDPRKYMPTYA